MSACVCLEHTQPLSNDMLIMWVSIGSSTLMRNFRNEVSSGSIWQVVLLLPITIFCISLGVAGVRVSRKVGDTT